jgi:ABC-type branched-subunit amino acid transport system permease subunit
LEHALLKKYEPAIRKKERDMTKVSWIRPLQRWKTFLLWVGFAVLLTIIPQVAQSNIYWISIIDEMAIYIILATGMNLAMGYGGQFNLAIGAIFGVGAYTTGICLLHGYSFLLAFVTSAVLGTVVSTFIGLPALRVRSHYLALVTLGLGQALNIIFVNWTAVTGGDNGLLDIPFASLGPLQFDNFINYINLIYLIFAVMFVMLGIAAVFVHSRFGRNLKAVRDDPIAARASGINVGVYRLACFALSGLFAGVAGSLYTVWVGTVGPSAFDLNQSIFVLAQVLIGGLGTLSGSIVGAVGLVWLDQYLLAFGDWHNIIYGSLIAIIVLLARGGIVGGVKALWQRLKHRLPTQELTVSPAPVLVASGIRDEKKGGN